MFWAAGATLECFGQMLKERKPPDLGKGRANVELLELIRKIRTHETKKLNANAADRRPTGQGGYR
jgi:hypothetical protein